MKHGTRTFVAVVAASILFVAESRAEEKEPAAVVEIGAASEWDLAGGSSFGPSAAVEFSPVKNLILEVGVAPLFSAGRAEWGTDLLFKKSFDLSNSVEVEPGIGPEWSSGGKIAAEVSLEFMIWPSPERKFGYFIEPSYSYVFTSGHERSLGMTAGLLIAIP
jgi:hypothetical protein